MKKNKITNFITYFFEYLITFFIADNVTNFLGIRYKKFLSLNFAIYIIIVTIVVVTLDFLISEVKNKYKKRKSSQFSKE